MFIHLFEACLALDPAIRGASDALVSLMLLIQVICFRVLAIQAQRYLKELFSLGTRILRTLDNDKWPGCGVSEMLAAARRTR